MNDLRLFTIIVLLLQTIAVKAKSQIYCYDSTIVQYQNFSDSMPLISLVHEGRIRKIHSFDINNCTLQRTKQRIDANNHWRLEQLSLVNRNSRDSVFSLHSKRDIARTLIRQFMDEQMDTLCVNESSNMSQGISPNYLFPREFNLFYYLEPISIHPSFESHLILQKAYYPYLSRYYIYMINLKQGKLLSIVQLAESICFTESASMKTLYQNGTFEQRLIFTDETSKREKLYCCFVLNREGHVVILPNSNSNE